ncbi:acyl-CoA thioesterase [Chromobacterium sphagni]|uniref:Thioesterase n=1 Tax=Chromobacterium sphagni TaxID=1903179 RepID=A0A1S1WV38_9NEIS|nr:thioesterase family protein [Chromobacterium sphagni]OHX10859.1 thioesterase [Chromobacterium sphagni]OHX19544.1 thioesterase [Chromobacterium sphagni]
MARLTLDLPDRFIFETRLDIRIGDINYAQHLANDALLRLAHEARLRLFKHLGYASELTVDGLGIVIADMAACYHAEAFHGDLLRFGIGIAALNRYGLDLIYQAVDDNTGKEVARLKTGIVFFDYRTRKIAPMPEAFSGKLSQ